MTSDSSPVASSVPSASDGPDLPDRRAPEPAVERSAESTPGPSAEPPAPPAPPAPTSPRSPTSPTMAAYRAGCRRYAEAVTAAHGSRTEAEERYRSEVAAVRDVARRAVARREAAVRSAQDAKRLLSETDDAAAEVWRRLAVYADRRKLGLTPAPDLDADPRTPGEIRVLLSKTRQNIGLAQRGELPFPPPAHAIPIAAGIGAAGGMSATWAAGLFLAAADGRTDGTAAAFQALALVAVFVGLFAGIPMVSGWLAIRHRIGVRPVHILTTVIGAVAATCALSPFTLLG